MQKKVAKKGKMYIKLQIGKLVKTWCLVVVVFDIPVVCIDLPGTANLRIQGVPQKITLCFGEPYHPQNWCYS